MRASDYELTVRFWNNQARNFVIASFEKTFGTLRLWPFMDPFWPSLSTLSRPSSFEPHNDKSSSPINSPLSGVHWVESRTDPLAALGRIELRRDKRRVRELRMSDEHNTDMELTTHTFRV
ncbi:unnamed protein product [Cylicostephanus goldi]|uniref:Uncharacterized protein n=1 Tax=Cylicostephanus goldi TaxID=71465 RepID=A0A3P6SBC1_CYLGO|nr:unnamed protein product [Cylicostephanus goldi]